MIGYYSPSYKRPNDVHTHKWLDNVVYVVSYSESKSYANTHNNLWVVPDEAQGSVSRIRNYILDNAIEDQIVMLDDDITHFARWTKQKSEKLNGTQFNEFVEEGFILAEQMDVRLWGVNLLQDKGAYREYTPFSMTQCILGPFQAFNKLDLRYDENLPLKEDYDLSLQVLHKYHKTLRFNAYHYVAKQHTNTGGCADYRTMQREKEQFELLVRKWGSKIVQQDPQAEKKGVYDINPIIKVPIKGV